MSSHTQNQVPVTEIEAKPHESLQVSLGFFKEANEFKGFSIEYTPETLKKDSVESQITMSKQVKDMREYTLNLVNKSSEAICAAVWVV